MKRLTDTISEAIGWFAEAFSKLSIRRDSAPIGTVDRLFEFARTRSAFVTQKKLYGYLKERMGVSYPKMFEDEHIARSIDIAKMHVFAAALSDLTVFVVAHATSGSSLDRGEKSAMALACYDAGLAANAEQAPDGGVMAGWRSAFEARLGETVWENVAAGGSPFTESPKALIRWAPIADEHKKYDREIVENSIRFAWNEIRQDFRTRLDTQGVVADWLAGTRPDAA